MALMESKAEAMKREARHTAASAETEAEESRRLADEAKRREAEAHDQVPPPCRTLSHAQCHAPHNWAHRDPWSLSHADTAAQALAERRERMAAELAMQATNERIKAARAGRAEAEQGMNNAREMERDLRQQLANLEVEFSEQSGQVAALLERLRRQEDLTTAGECTGERAQGV